MPSKSYPLNIVLRAGLVVPELLRAPVSPLKPQSVRDATLVVGSQPIVQHLGKLRVGLDAEPRLGLEGLLELEGFKEVSLAQDDGVCGPVKCLGVGGNSAKCLGNPRDKLGGYSTPGSQLGRRPPHGD